MILKLDMQHQGLNLYKVYINDDSRLTMTYFTAKSNWVTYTNEWGKTVTNSLNGGNLTEKDLIDLINVLLK